MMNSPQIYQGDCLDILPGIPAGSVDLVLADLPYGKTPQTWDSVIPMTALWAEYLRVCKPNGAIVLFGKTPFSALLCVSNLPLYRYSWIWQKDRATRYLDANRMPLDTHEDILVFYRKRPTYNPQMTVGKPNHQTSVGGFAHSSIHQGGHIRLASNQSGQKFPRSILSFPGVPPSKRLHPNQKPVPLLSYLIRTYTQSGEVVLDNTMGSGSTGVACLKTERRFIGMEKDGDIFATAQQRLTETMNQGVQLSMSLFKNESGNAFPRSCEVGE